MTKLSFAGFVILCILGCSPKTNIPVPPPVASQPASPKEDLSNLSPCTNWLKLPNQDDISNEYIIYRDALKQKNYAKALEGWKKVYAAAPAADGKRSTVFDDGIRIYTHYFEQEKDTLKKREYVTTVLALYDESARCYPTGSNVHAQKAFQYYYSFPGYATDDEIFTLFQKALDKDGLQAEYFILNPFTALLIQRFLDNKITLAETQQYASQVKTILANGLKNCKTAKECDPWNIINDYVPSRLADLEGVEGFYDCAYYKSKYFKDFQASPEDCEAIHTVYGRLRWAKCPDDDQAITDLRAARDKHCKKPVEVKVTSVSQAVEAINEGNYKLGIEFLKKAINETEDKPRKAELNMHIAKIYYANLRNFGEARRHAREAASLKPNWGEPYMLIGNLYASSGPLCGPGRGFESQRVVWVAIDKWIQARNVDPSIAAEANKQIARYTQYMPEVGDLHMMNIPVGSSLFIGCWINESTTVRAKPQ
jgi:tetratricopeptide (TPR) repeat protein